MTDKIRCAWVPLDKPLYIKYHDEEWGVPVHDDRHLFEAIVLDGAQAGLSWWAVLNKRENYRNAYDNFHPEIVASYDEKKIQELLINPGIVRNQMKIRSSVKNAQAFLKIQEEFGTFDSYIWGFVGGKTKVNHRKSIKEVPPSTTESDTMSKDLKKRGFTFVGSTICYAFMQAVGMVNDHTIDCFRYDQV
ncbi:MAG: DNA-3-methyladenine glycosylase I [Candidatus Omnitrophota bacterium]